MLKIKQVSRQLKSENILNVGNLSVFLWLDHKEYDDILIDYDELATDTGLSRRMCELSISALAKNNYIERCFTRTGRRNGMILKVKKTIKFNGVIK